MQARGKLSGGGPALVRRSRRNGEIARSQLCCSSIEIIAGETRPKKRLAAMAAVVVSLASPRVAGAAAWVSLRAASCRRR